MSGPVQTPEQQADRPEGWWAYPAVYAVTVYVVGFVPHMTWWAAAGIGVVFALLGRVLARHSFHPTAYGADFSWWAQALGVAAGLATGAWLWGARIVGGPLVAWPWLVYGAGALGVAHLVLMWVAPSAARAHLREPDVAAAAHVSLQVLYQGVLKRAGSVDVRVTDVVVSPSGGVESVHLTPVVVGEGEKRTPVNRNSFTSRLQNLVVELDQTLSRRADRPARIDDQDVHVEQGAGGSEWIMHVTVARPLDVTSHFVPADTPQPWCGPKRAGRYEDDKPMYVTFCDEQEGAADGEFVGMKGSGKTGALNVIIARHLESDQGEVWLVGTNKLIKLARPWLEPWLRGETDRPVIDWVGGEGPQAALRALASAYQYAVECNRKTRGNDARKPSRGKGALCVIMEEAPDLLERNTVKIMCCDGVERNASQLAAKLQDISRSAPVELWKVSQNALFDSFGTDGAKQRRNVGIGVAGKCKTPQDAQRVIPGLPRADPTKLRNQAVFVEQLYDEPREVRARWDFIEDAAIPTLAKRYTPWRYGLDPAITKSMPFFAERWEPQWHAAFVKEIESEGLVWPGSRPHTELAPQTAQAAQPQEDTTVGNAYRNPDDLVDLWDLFDQPAAGEAELKQSTLSNPDPSAMTAGFHKLGQWVRDQEAKQHGSGIPDPLGVVIALLDLPGAPTDWVSTEVLAVASQRVSPYADAEAKRRAAEQLSRDLTAQDPMLASVKTQERVDGVRKRGYPVPALRAAADRARRRAA